MENTTAYRIGEIAGAVMVILLLFGICVFFVIALVKAITTRRKGWVIAASVSAVPFLILTTCFLIAFVAGFKRGLAGSMEISAAKRGEPSELLTAPMTPVAGNAISYEISLPLADEWQKNDSHPPFDYVFSYRDAYVAIIPEEIGLQTPENARNISQKNLSSKAAECTFTGSHPIEIDSHSWLTYDATATVRQIHIKYRFYVYADTNYTYQIITWTGPMLFNRDAPVFDRIATSFKMPK